MCFDLSHVRKTVFPPGQHLCNKHFACSLGWSDSIALECRKWRDLSKSDWSFCWKICKLILWREDLAGYIQHRYSSRLDGRTPDTWSSLCFEENCILEKQQKFAIIILRASLVPRRLGVLSCAVVRAKCGKERARERVLGVSRRVSLGDVTAHGRVQDCPSRDAKGLGCLRALVWIAARRKGKLKGLRRHTQTLFRDDYFLRGYSKEK